MLPMRETIQEWRQSVSIESPFLNPFGRVTVLSEGMSVDQSLLKKTLFKVM